MLASIPLLFQNSSKITYQTKHFMETNEKRMKFVLILNVHDKRIFDFTVFTLKAFMLFTCNKYK